MDIRSGAKVGVVVALLAALCGCGGEPVPTGELVTASGGAIGRVGTILVRDVHFAWDGELVEGGVVYGIGEDVALQATIVNDAVAVVDGRPPDRLVAVRSPIATSARITGDARIADGQTLTAGYDKRIAGVALPPEGTIEITLVGLTTPLRAGQNYPVVFVFERAGELRIDAVPVENPSVLPPRAVDKPPDTGRIETGPEPLEVPS
ncbi:MAG: hypothetical protein L0H84_07685 [Pseudonocardia sp.]|nr:hypothetical protein [Pseudonocardia sp.]